MDDSLKYKTIRALIWSFLESISVRGAQFVIAVVMARLLSPEHFGLIGMLIIFIALAESLIDSGFQAALIQKSNATQTDICSIFYFNIVVGLITAWLLCLTAPWIAAFYHQPILKRLMRALSLTLVINSLGSIHNTILMKKIEFKTLTKVSLISSVFSGIIGIFFATTGFGVWSLVFQQISRAFFWTVSMWLFTTWRPTFTFSLKSLREMFGFGSRILISGFINRIFENIYLLVIGKLFSATDLGFFTRAKMMEEIPSQTLSWVVGRVTFPVFATIQDDLPRLKRGIKKALSALALVNFPMMVGLAIIARPLVLALLTEKWAECIPYLRLLCLAGLFFPLILINSNLLFALGRSKIHLRVEIIKKILIVINIAITWRWGISTMICGMIVTSILFFYLNSYYTGALIGYSTREQLYDIFPIFTAAVLMGMGVFTIGLLPFPNHWAALLVQIPIGSVIYICLCKLFRLAAFREIWEAGWSKLSSFRASAAR